MLLRERRDGGTHERETHERKNAGTQGDTGTVRLRVLGGLRGGALIGLFCY